ncbi:Chromosome partition protein Smc [compost metagenome]
MSGLKQFFKEVSAIVRNPKVLIPVIAVLMIPVLYSAMFLGAFWDPYAKMNDLPVAIVNSDKGTQFEGKELHIGDDFIDKLKESDSFSWSFIDKSEAEQGLRDNKYYMAIEIPENFSERTTTLTSTQPTPAEITFMPNESYNFLAAQIGNTAIETMKTELNKEVTKAYTRTVFDQVKTLADGLDQASVGAGDIAKGTDSAKTGIMLIEENLSKLANGSLVMKDGIGKLVSGGSQLDKGTADLKAGATAVSDGLSQLGAANTKLAEGAVQTSQGAASLSAGLTKLNAESGKLTAGAAGLANGLAQFAEASPELAKDANFQKLVETSKQIASGVEATKNAQDQLAAGATQLTQGSSQLSSGLQQFGSKLTEAGAGSVKVAEGAGQLNVGAKQLNQGLISLSSSFDTIVNGSEQLDQGAQELSQGLVKLTDGTGELSTKLNEAAQKTSDIKGGDSFVDMFTTPVDLNITKNTEVPNYGTGFAPYFISLGLFVGALLLTIVFTVKEPAVKPTSGWSWFAGKMMTMVLIGAVQSIIADVVLLYGLGLEVQNLPLFFLLSFITSVAFMSMIQFLVTVFQHPGRFIAIVILIFQLTTSAGTFPLELIPSWLQKASSLFPMTYSVAGLKAVISSGNYSIMWSNVWVLIGYAVAFSLMTLIYFVVSYRKEYVGSSIEETQAA